MEETESFKRLERSRGRLRKVEGECGGNSTSQVSVSSLVGRCKEACRGCIRHGRLLRFR